tara:strand:+ start:14522 stop:16282 length:1761 start_codon:yes stop_codon:yes gene_type:complete
MANDIKKDADAQRAQQAPQPRPKEEGGSLSDVVDQLKKGNSEQSKTTEANVGLVANMVSIANAVESSGLKANAALDGLADSLLGNKLKDLEKNKEDAARDDKTNELLEELVENTDQSLLDSPKGFFGTALAILGGLGGALAGIIGGFIIGVSGQVKFLAKAIVKPFTAIGKIFGRLLLKIPGVQKTINGLKGIRSYFTNLNRLFSGVDTTIRKSGKLTKMNVFEKGIKNLGKFFRSIKQFPSTLFNGTKVLAGNVSAAAKGFFSKFKIPKAFSIGDEVKELGQTFTKLKSGVAGFVRPFTKTAEQAGKISKLVMMVVQPFRIMKEFFKVFAAKFKPLGKILGKLFLPVTIIMGIFDGIKGAISGAEEESGTAGKFVGGLMGAISGILVGLVGMPLDLLKDLVSWIAGKMGMDGASEFLDSFSFSAIIGGVFDVVKDFFMAIVDFFTDLFSEGPSAAFGNLGTNINELFKKILRSILPDPSVEREWYNPIGFIQRAIPDGLYEYAGMDPKTGEIDAQYKEAIDAEVKKTGEDLNAGSIDAADSKNASQGVTANTVVDSSSKRSSNQTINIMGPTTGLATANELRFQG